MGPPDFQDLETSSIQICMRDAEVQCSCTTRPYFSCADTINIRGTTNPQQSQSKNYGAVVKMKMLAAMNVCFVFANDPIIRSV
jgi:hypothetical protein